MKSNVKTKSTMLTAENICALGCPEEHQPELMGSGVTVEQVQSVKDAAEREGKRVNWLAMLQFIRKYKSLAIELFAAIGAGPIALGTFLLAHAGDAATIWADFMAIFS